MKYLTPITNPVPGSTFQQPTHVAVTIVCKACHRAAGHVLSTGELELKGDHAMCGVLDFGRVKNAVAAKYRVFGNTGVRQSPVKILPQPLA